MTIGLAWLRAVLSTRWNGLMYDLATPSHRSRPGSWLAFIVRSQSSRQESTDLDAFLTYNPRFRMGWAVARLALWVFALWMWQGTFSQLSERLEGHAILISGLAVAPNGAVYSAGWDNRITRWDVRTAVTGTVYAGRTAGAVRSLTVSPTACTSPPRATKGNPRRTGRSNRRSVLSSSGT